METGERELPVCCLCRCVAPEGSLGVTWALANLCCYVPSSSLCRPPSVGPRPPPSAPLPQLLRALHRRVSERRAQPAQDLPLSSSLTTVTWLRSPGWGAASHRLRNSVKTGRRRLHPQRLCLRPLPPLPRPAPRTMRTRRARRPRSQNGPPSTLCPRGEGQAGELLTMMRAEVAALLPRRQAPAAVAPGQRAATSPPLAALPVDPHPEGGRVTLGPGSEIQAEAQARHPGPGSGMAQQQEGGRGEAMTEAPIATTLGREVLTAGVGARLRAGAVVHPKGVGARL